MNQAANECDRAIDDYAPLLCPNRLRGSRTRISFSSSNADCVISTADSGPRRPDQNSEGLGSRTASRGYNFAYALVARPYPGRATTLCVTVTQTCSCGLISP